MTADLLRQLDAYGDHIETLIDHVAVDEIKQRALLADKPKRRRSDWLPNLAAGGAVVALIVVVAFGTLSGSAVDSNFNEIGSALGGGSPSQPAPRQSSPPKTSAPATTAAPRPTTVAPTTVTPTTVTPTPPAPGETPPGGNALAGRDIVFVATMQVSVTDAVDAADRAGLAVESLGGFVSGEKTTGGANAVSILTFKVPPTTFRTAVARLGDLGVVTDQEITADDVTEVVVDLQSQITSTELSVERLRTFLAEATDVSDVADLEKELTDRERNLEQLRGQLKTLDDRVALATIRVTLTEAIQNPKLEISTGAYRARDDEGAGCLGQRPLQIQANRDATVCIQIANTGKTELTDIDLSGPGMALLTGNLIEVEGRLGEVLAPDSVVVVAADVTVDRRIREDLTVTAIPINEAGDPVPERQVEVTKRIAIDIAAAPDPGGLPGFGDAWDAGVSSLVGVGSVALVVLGAILPWLWLPAVVLGVMWWRRRR